MRAEFAVQELTDAGVHSCEAHGTMTLNASFDEFNLDIELNYAGDRFEAPDTRPTPDEIIEHEGGVRRLAGFLIRQQSDRVTISGTDGAWSVRVHFDH